MNRKIDIGEDKNLFVADSKEQYRPQSKFLMEDVAKTPDEALSDARRLTSMNWINSEPLIMGHVDEEGKAYLFHISDEAKDRVVLLDFWDYTLLPCRRGLSYLKEWHRRYGTAGFLIIGVHSPMYKFGADKKNVLDAVKAAGIEYPVVMDNGFDLWRSLENRYWPRRVLFDSKWRVQEDRAGEGGYDVFERAIQHLLRELSPGLPCPPIMKPVRKIDEPDYLIPATTLEIFLGSKRGIGFGNAQAPKGLNEETVFTDTAMGAYAPGLPYLNGAWIMGEESIFGSPAARESIRLAISFIGTDAYVVARARAKNPVDIAQAVRATVMLDGRPVASENCGADCVVNDAHRSTATFRDPRLHHIVSGLEHKQHELTIEVSSTGLDTIEVYALAFEHNA